MPAVRTSPRRARRAAAARLPVFALYGDAPAVPPTVLHIESIEARSRRHHWEIDVHVHRGLHQLIWLRGGRAAVRLDEASATAEAPAMILVPPGVAHAFRFAPHSDGFVLTIQAMALAEADTAGLAEALRTLFAVPRVLRIDAQTVDAEHAQRLLEALQAQFERAESPALLWLARAAVWQLAQFAREPAAAAERALATQPSALYTRWLALLEAHYLEHWPVSRYADRLGLSTERLNRLLRMHTGRNAQRLVHDRLLREACRRLVHLAAPVSSLAFELGFDDAAYFGRFFRRNLGISPRAYRLRAWRPAA